MGTTIDERQHYSDDSFEKLRSELTHAAEVCSGRACVYATGSFGRREASGFSDLDLFIVSLGADKRDSRWLSKLDEIVLKAELILASRKLRFPPFSRDGEFLQHHTSHRLIATTGTETDDSTNTFTARLLLLLESKPLIGADVHSLAIDEVIAKYWKEFPDHSDCFMPAYLSNDILRYWRTLCLNYEARTSERTAEDRAKRKLANYKLKHSRMLTCFSALLLLLKTYVEKGTVTIGDARTMVSLTPVARLEAVARGATGEFANAAAEILSLYDKFLTVTNASENDLVRLFSDKERRKSLREEQSRFGDLVYEALHSIGKGNKLYRRLVV
jgi:hypothetical protein